MEYRPRICTFLLRADGWLAFFQDVDLFGTEELAGAPAVGAKELISFFEDEVFAASGVELDGIFPIAASRTDTDVFVMPTASQPGLSPVIWFAGIEIERYSGFGEFFRAMRSYNLAQAEKLRASDA